MRDDIMMDKISSNNVMLPIYMKVISSWDENGDFADIDNDISNMYFLYYANRFLGCARLTVIPEDNKAIANVITGLTSMYKDAIIECFEEKVRNAVEYEYGISDVTFNDKRQKEKSLCKIMKD